MKNTPGPFASPSRDRRKTPLVHGVSRHSWRSDEGVSVEFTSGAKAISGPARCARRAARQPGAAVSNRSSGRRSEPRVAQAFRSRRGRETSLPVRSFRRAGRPAAARPGWPARRAALHRGESDPAPDVLGEHQRRVLGLQLQAEAGRGQPEALHRRAGVDVVVDAFGRPSRRRARSGRRRTGPEADRAAGAAPACRRTSGSSAAPAPSSP